MPRDLHRKPFNDATPAKLELFRKHIDAWLGVFVGSGRTTKKKIRISYVVQARTATAKKAVHC